MKKLLFALTLCFTLCSSVPKDCIYKETPLYGKVKVVSFNATFKVKIVSYNADLEVKTVEYAADDCGEWQFVDFGEDFTVQFVDFGEDFTIKFVDYNPGVH